MVMPVIENEMWTDWDGMGWDGMYVDAIDSVKCSFDVRERADFKCKKSFASISLKAGNTPSLSMEDRRTGKEPWGVQGTKC